MKNISLLLIAVIFSISSYAQLHFGPQIGYTASMLSLNVDDIKNEMKSNLLIGAFARIGSEYYFQPEINYLTQGSVFKWPAQDNVSPLEQNITIKTLQVPANVGWRALNTHLVNVRIFGGIVMDFNLDTVIENSFETENHTKLVPDDFKSFTWQWDTGVGVDVLMFSLDIKYFGGLNNILDNIQYKNKEITAKPNLFVVTLGWKIF